MSGMLPTGYFPEDAEQPRCAHCGRFARETGCDSDHDPSTVRAVTPPPATPEEGELECGARHPHFPEVTSSCTQPLGHDGPHVSVDDYAQWPEEGDRG